MRCLNSIEIEYGRNPVIIILRRQSEFLPTSAHWVFDVYEFNLEIDFIY